MLSRVLLAVAFYNHWYHNHYNHNKHHVLLLLRETSSKNVTNSVAFSAHANSTE
jgi:ribosomal protein S17E